MNKYTLAVVSTALLGAFAVSSCETHVGQGAAVGAMTGALVGGGHHGHVGGAAAGAVIGAAAGALVGAAISEEEARRHGPPPENGYPRARWSTNMGYVHSPCSDAIVDVRRIPPGALVRDPSAPNCFFRRP